MTSSKLITRFLITSCLFISALSQVPAPIIKSLHIESDIKYTYAKTLVISRVLNPANVSQEVVFRVVLPEEAFITAFTMYIEGEPYEAYIKEKEEAKQEYDAAVNAGQSAGLVAQSSRYSKDFTVSVNVKAEEKVKFNLTYEELLTRTNKTYKNDININPGQIVSDISVIVNIEDALDIKNLKVPQFKMSNEIDQTETENKNAKIEVISPKKVRVEWKPTKEEQKTLNTQGLNGQMVVKYDVDTTNNSQLILVDQDGYFVHILRNDDLPVLNKHVIFVLDVSGSMYGNKIEQLKQAMEKILNDLSHDDFFSIVLFSVKLLPWKRSGVDLDILNGYDDGLEPMHVPVNDEYIVPATQENILSAVEFCKNLSIYGGTNINGGLRVGIDIAKLGQKNFQNKTSKIEPMIIFLTDGDPNYEESDPDKIIDNVRKRNTGKATIFSISLGFDADIKFLKKLSLDNNGFARRVYADSDAALQLNNFYKEVASPVLSDISFDYLPEQVENYTPESKNLFSGSEVIIVGKMVPKSNVTGSISAITPSGMIVLPFPPEIVIIPPTANNETIGYLQKMWAYKTIKSLLDQNTVSKNDTIEKKAKELALKYKFVTPLTSLVVVKPNVSSVMDDQVDNGLVQPFPFQAQRGSPLYGAGGGGVFAFSSLAMPMAPPAYSYSGQRYIKKLYTAHHRVGSFSFGSPAMASSFGSIPHKYAPTTFATSSSLPENEVLSSTLYSETTTDVTNPDAKNHTKIPYTNVSWLNQTTDGFQFIQPPPEVDQNDVIALNETDVSTNKCSNGNDCRHFIFCALNIFADSFEEYLPFKCHIDPKFLGVCCPP